MILEIDKLHAEHIDRNLFGVFFLFSFSRIDSFLVEEFIFWNPLRNFEFNKAENKCIDKS